MVPVKLGVDEQHVVQWRSGYTHSGSAGLVSLLNLSNRLTMVTGTSWHSTWYLVPSHAVLSHGHHIGGGDSRATWILAIGCRSVPIYYDAVGGRLWFHWELSRLILRYPVICSIHWLEFVCVDTLRGAGVGDLDRKGGLNADKHDIIWPDVVALLVRYEVIDYDISHLPTPPRCSVNDWDYWYVEVTRCLSSDR